MTGLTIKGQVPDTVRYATSRSVAKIQIEEVVDNPSSEMLSNPDGERRIRIHQNATTIHNRVAVQFLRVDPGMLALVAGVKIVYRADPDAPGFGEGGFGEFFFGGDEGDAMGFDEVLRRKPVAFALEVWSNLAGQRCADGSPMYGYTLFPFLKGGRLTGFRFANGLVSFNVVGAQTRRNPGWGVGPHDLEGPFQRLLTPVGRGVSWRQFITPAAPPAQVCGIQTLLSDAIDNGTAANPLPDPTAAMVVDGGGATTSAWIIDGGRA